MSNGTIALQITIKALDLHGEIITTPFSYVATTSSIVWEGCQPVFVDIDQHTLCIDPNLIEAAITDKTTGILATHVYGIPCDVEKIKAVAEKHGLKVIYDAAHTFGGKYKGKSIASYGDISTLSFHATKVFHTVEGGAIVTDNDDLAHRINYMRNFGHKGQEDFWGLGINGKNSEFHAAMGLCNLTHMGEILLTRKNLSEWYDRNLHFSNLVRPKISSNIEYNYAYYPIILIDENLLNIVQNELNGKGIYPRRYFFPALSCLPYINEDSNFLAEKVSRTILCLPLYPGLEKEDMNSIINLIIMSNEAFKIKKFEN